MKTKLLVAVCASALFMMGCGGGGGSGGNLSTQLPVCSDILDSATNLYIYDNGSPDIPNWQDANTSCNALAASGCGDWRLPTLAEMQGIYNNSTFDSNLSHWTYEYWASDDNGSSGPGYHGCFDVDGNTTLECSDNAPISYSCVHENS